MSAKHLAQGLALYQGLGKCWQLLGSDALLAAACGSSCVLGMVSGLSGLKMAGYQAWVWGHLSWPYSRGCWAGGQLPGAGKDCLHGCWASEDLVDTHIM